MSNVGCTHQNKLLKQPWCAGAPYQMNKDPREGVISCRSGILATVAP